MVSCVIVPSVPSVGLLTIEKVSASPSPSLPISVIVTIPPGVTAVVASKAMGEAFSVPETTVVLASGVSVTVTPVASIAPMALAISMV